MKTRCIDYDLRRPVDRIWGLENYERLQVLVRNDGQPLGLFQLVLPRLQTTLSADELEQHIEHRLGMTAAVRRALSAVPSETPPTWPAISVIVCTRDRAQSLRRCLTDLAKLDYERFEVIVVDNASQDAATEMVVAESGLRYVREDRPGLDWARNRGAAEASFDIIAYVDDDARVDPAWLRGIARGFASPDVWAVTGLTLPAELETRAQHLFQIYGGMSKGMSPRRFSGPSCPAKESIAVHHVGVGTNMAYRRSALERLGNFDTALDVGTPSNGGGDLDMFHRVLASGGIIQYEPSALVWHRDRRDMAGLERQLYNNGRAFAIYLIKCWRSRTVARGALARYAFFWARWLAGRPILRLLKRHRLPMRLLVAEIRGAFSAPWAYGATYRYDRQLKANG